MIVRNRFRTYHFIGKSSILYDADTIQLRPLTDMDTFRHV